VILIKATVYDVAFYALREARLPVVDERVPFPGSGQQKRFEGRVCSRFALTGRGAALLSRMSAFKLRR
jgi:hypothetical protein